MSTQTATGNLALPRVANERRVIAGLIVAVAVFLIGWGCLDFWFFAHARIDDTDIYQAYGLKMRSGLIPYRDFAVEYPPGALPMFVLPTYFSRATNITEYSGVFSVIMALCGLGILGLTLLSKPTPRTIAVVALSPLLVGYMIETHFDLWPALLVAAATAAFLHDRHRLGWLVLGCAFAAKLYAVVLVPLAVIWTLRRRGKEELRRGAAIWLLSVAAIFVPFAAVSPHGLWQSLWGQLSRPLQVESLAASFLMTFAHPDVIVSHGAASIPGHPLIEVLSTGLGLVCLVVLWTFFARGEMDEDRFIRYAAACICAFIAFGKVFSPQYLIWLIPLVPLVRGRRGLVASGVLIAAMIATQFWVSSNRYGRYLAHQDYAPLVLARNLAMVALVAILAWPKSTAVPWHLSRAVRRGPGGPPAEAEAHVGR